MKLQFFNTNVKIEFSFLLVLALCFLIDNYDVLYVILFSTLHEAGHLLSLICFKQQAEQITISYYGIGLKCKVDFPTVKELIFYSSGLAVNLIFVVLSVKREINFALFLINVLPIYPLDGGRILKIVLNSVFSLNISDKIFFVISGITVVLLIILSIYFKNISLILISVYSLFFAINNTFD